MKPARITQRKPVSKEKTNSDSHGGTSLQSQHPGKPRQKAAKFKLSLGNLVTPISIFFPSLSETGLSYAVQAGLKLKLLPKCRITGMRHHTQKKEKKKIKSSGSNSAPKSRLQFPARHHLTSVNPSTRSLRLEVGVGSPPTDVPFLQAPENPQQGSTQSEASTLSPCSDSEKPQQKQGPKR